MGDTSRHLTSFKVENFKRFESFEMDNLGQFNLIVGDNNVGKTSVLEALLYNEQDWFFINNLFLALDFRKIKGGFFYRDLDLYCNKNQSLDQIIYAINYEVVFVSGEKSSYQLIFDKKDQNITLKGLPNVLNKFNLFSQVVINYNMNLPLIPFYKGHDRDLTNFFSKEILPSRTKRRKMISSLKILIPDIEEIQLSSPDPNEFGYLIVSQSKVDATIPLALFGDGVLKLFRILIEILNNKGKRLMIDEVDAGIHFSHFKQFWKIILSEAKENEVQLFMTTHNEECIKYFKEALEDELPKLQNDARSITLVENSKTKKVNAYTYTFEQLEANIDIGNEIRGGGR